jgi:hypothetical protein
MKKAFNDKSILEYLNEAYRFSCLYTIFQMKCKLGLLNTSINSYRILGILFNKTKKNKKKISSLLNMRYRIFS